MWCIKWSNNNYSSGRRHITSINASGCQCDGISLVPKIVAIFPSKANKLTKNYPQKAPVIELYYANCENQLKCYKSYNMK